MAASKSLTRVQPNAEVISQERTKPLESGSNKTVPGKDQASGKAPSPDLGTGAASKLLKEALEDEVEHYSDEYDEPAVVKQKSSEKKKAHESVQDKR